MDGSNPSSTPPREDPAPSDPGPPKRGSYHFDDVTGILTVTANRETKGPVKTVYRVERLSPHSDVGTEAVRLVVIVGENFDSYDLVRRPWGWACECPDFVERRADKGEVCKHLGAALGAGVIRK